MNKNTIVKKSEDINKKWSEYEDRILLEELNRNIDFEYHRIPENMRIMYSYLFSQIRLNTDVQKKIDNFTVFGTTNFEQTEIRNNKDLSMEEEFLLEDIINQENIPSTIDETIPDFE